MIAYTAGEPAGIGPDIILQLAAQSVLEDVVCIADRELLTSRAEAMGPSMALLDYPQRPATAGELSVLHQPLAKQVRAGEPQVDNVPAVLASLDRAVDGCLTGEFAAMLTGPLHKGIINQAGVAFSGHTEYIAQRTKSTQPVMLLACDDLRVALATTHLPLSAVSGAISEQVICSVCRILHADLRDKYAIKSPRILVCGLNPHAGEGGHLGREEIEIIEPALEKLRAEGIQVIGPLPADTLFTPRYLENADVVLTMYHDQGLPVLKALAFGRAANITLGLPIIRTSVDHGTAFDLAGSGSADIGSLQTALRAARDMVKRANA
ncbi:MAG: 4-hydroxythreonine-4-phosphate dehydrogenase PdxA [Gammaproteobacteria bacterium]|nr:4-hydroxythreonine-4-phosphate dehydrogenase PdxA [Gammaproteobacteria bacterium]